MFEKLFHFDLKISAVLRQQWARETKSFRQAQDLLMNMVGHAALSFANSERPPVVGIRKGVYLDLKTNVDGEVDVFYTVISSSPSKRPRPSTPVAQPTAPSLAARFERINVAPEEYDAQFAETPPRAEQPPPSSLAAASSAAAAPVAIARSTGFSTPLRPRSPPLPTPMPLRGAARPSPRVLKRSFPFPQAILSGEEDYISGDEKGEDDDSPRPVKRAHY
jgi:hypothetical protein